MHLSLLRFAARHPLASLGAVLSLPLALGAAGWAARSAERPAAVRPADDPALLVDRLWLDAYPEKPTDTFSLWYLFDNDMALYRRGTGFRFQVDLLEYQRKNDRVAFTVLEDQKKTETKYTIKACSDKPPFDLCLVFERAPLGPVKFYGFKDSEQYARRMPWLGVSKPGTMGR